uniref:Uncharacterized protein n=1 Tax=Rhizophora mucronata TaxID=61149 RepID=A0A2P2QC50_RHIMU
MMFFTQRCFHLNLNFVSVWPRMGISF